MREDMFLCLSPNLPNKARTNMGLSPTMGFLNENDNLAYFAILGNCRQVCLLLWAFFKTSSFLSLIVGFFQGAKKDMPRNTLIF